MADILIAYAFINPEKKVFKSFEKILLKSLKSLSVESVVLYLQAFSKANQGSTELYLAFDKIIGSNVKYIKSDEIAPILHSFSKTEHHREKLFILF